MNIMVMNRRDSVTVASSQNVFVVGGVFSFSTKTIGKSHKLGSGGKEGQLC